MAKDPAVLLYTSDFLTGTILMNYEQKGKYITLLCIQHQHGIIDKISFDIIVGDDNMLKSKFIENINGFYNQRMLEETNKRKSYCESRSLNKLGKKHNKKICESYDNHMENENKDVNRDVIVDKVVNTKEVNTKKCVFKKPAKTEIIDYINEKQLKVDSESFYDHYESNGWKVGKVPMKDWKATLRNWDRKTKEVKKPFKNEFLEELQKGQSI